MCRVVSAVGEYHFTVANYTDMLAPAYIAYFEQTLRIGLPGNPSLGLVLGYPIAYLVARERLWVRKTLLTFLFSMLFMSILVRGYALLLTFGSLGFQKYGKYSGVFTQQLQFYRNISDRGPSSRHCAKDHTDPCRHNSDYHPSSEAAALVLGTPRWKAFLCDAPASSRGVLSAFLIAYTLSLALCCSTYPGKGSCHGRESDLQPIF